MRTCARFLVVGLAGILFGCSSSYETRYQYNKKEDFSSLRTFSFLPAQAKERQNEVALEYITSAVTRELEKKGLKFQEESPDFVIAIYTEVTQAENLTDWGYSYTPYGPAWRASGYERGGDIDVYAFQEGAMILDFITPEENVTVWRGLARATLSEKRTPGEVEVLLNDVVTQLLENYPPPAQE
ncbi:MAG: DUF4136 domain-containing protein [Bacteroidetes bacterium]|nr:DUF4136 domain-containing protein [Bacteroidota bacterium]